MLDNFKIGTEFSKLASDVRGKYGKEVAIPMMKAMMWYQVVTRVCRLMDMAIDVLKDEIERAQKERQQDEQPQDRHPYNRQRRAHG